LPLLAAVGGGGLHERDSLWGSRHYLLAGRALQEVSELALT